jgi:hypothetical protein
LNPNLSLRGGHLAFGWYSLKPFPAHVSSKEREAVFVDGASAMLLTLSEDSSESDDDGSGL